MNIYFFSPRYILLEVAEDEDGHQQRRQRDGVAHGVHKVQSFKHLLQDKETNKTT